MPISLKFNYILYKINKMTVLIYLPKQLLQINKRCCLIYVFYLF